jgi:hypothetical protein
VTLANVYRISTWKVVAVVLFLLLLTLVAAALLQAGVIHAGGAPISHFIAGFCGSASGACP